MYKAKDKKDVRKNKRRSDLFTQSIVFQNSIVKDFYRMRASLPAMSNNKTLNETLNIPLISIKNKIAYHFIKSIAIYPTVNATINKKKTITKKTDVTLRRC